MPQLIDKIPHDFTKTNGNNFYSQFLNKKINFTWIFDLDFCQDIVASCSGIVAL